MLEVARLKALAREVGIAGLTQKGQQVILTLVPDMYLTPEEVIALIRSSQRRLAPLPGKERELLFRTEGLLPEQVSTAVRHMLQQIKELVAARTLVSLDSKEYNVTNE